MNYHHHHHHHQCSHQCRHHYCCIYYYHYYQRPTPYDLFFPHCCCREWQQWLTTMTYRWYRFRINYHSIDIIRYTIAAYNQFAYIIISTAKSIGPLLLLPLLSLSTYYSYSYYRGRQLTNDVVLLCWKRIFRVLLWIIFQCSVWLHIHYPGLRHC